MHINNLDILFKFHKIYNVKDYKSQNFKYQNINSDFDKSLSHLLWLAYDLQEKCNQLNHTFIYQSQQSVFTAQGKFSHLYHGLHLQNKSI